jgi:predicted small lipoprotein YifL
MAIVIRPLTCAAAVALSVAGCASKAPVAQAPVAPVAVVEVAVQPTAERDALGSYRFNMSQGDKKMTADEFDAWMKANGIRVARGAAAPAAADAQAAQQSDAR